MSYPRDEFDEVDEKTARRGTYRAVNADPAKSPKGAIPLVAAGVVGLLVGAAMYIYAPRTASPEYSAQKSASSSASTHSSASATSASASASATPRPPPRRRAWWTAFRWACLTRLPRPVAPRARRPC